MIIGISGKAGSGKDTVGKIIQYLTSKKDNKLKIKTYLDSQNNFIDDEFEIKKYAGKLKQIVSILTGIPVEDLEKQEVKDRVLGKEWWYYNLGNKTIMMPYTTTEATLLNKQYLVKPTVRQLLQEIGTDAMRNVIHPNIWVNALFADYKPINYSNNCKICGKASVDEDKEVSCTNCLPNWIITDVRFPNELQAVKNRGGITIKVNRSIWKPKAGEDIQIKVFSNWSNVTYTHTDEDGNHYGVGSDGYKYKSSKIRKKGEHPSEIALDNAEFDYVIENNEEISELIEKTKQILIKEKIICT